MSSGLKGIISALPTPFNNEQQIDTESLKKLVRFNIEQGMHGLYVGGSTGEAFLQDVTEREKVLETVAEEAGGKLTLIAHVGAISTRDSQLLARAAVKYGFDAISAVTPFYYPFSFEEHYAHYQAIINEADGLPMVVYNIPALSGVKLSLDQINTLVRLPGVQALKQTSGDLFQMEQIRRQHPELILYNGYDEIFASGVIAGADGGIGSTYNIMGWRYKNILSAIEKGDVQTARQIQTECNKVIDTLIKTGVLAGIKSLLHFMNV
ncbi:N-acetylneuraminate lyase, partial [Escherichia coli]|nr:N-acetylneuraminate lyase [Escherichia coli]